jgi:hypothetical protein
LPLVQSIFKCFLNTCTAILFTMCFSSLRSNSCWFKFLWLLAWQ